MYSRGAKTRTLSQITLNRAPTASSAVSVGTGHAGPVTSSKDLSFVLNNFKEIEKVSFDATLFCLLSVCCDTACNVLVPLILHSSGLVPLKEFFILSWFPQVTPHTPSST